MLTYLLENFSIAYALLSFGTLAYLINHAALIFFKSYQKSWYYAINALAAISLCIGSVELQSWPSLGVNLFWALISISSLFSIKMHVSFLTPKMFNYLTIASMALGCFASLHSFLFFAESLGWAAVFIFSGSYFLFANTQISVRQYSGLNAVAAIIILPSLWIDDNWPVMILEVSWAFISLYGWFKHEDPKVITAVE